jgi:hypothetical protein
VDRKRGAKRACEDVSVAESGSAVMVLRAFPVNIDPWRIMAMMKAALMLLSP